jgi:MscS family membrane protein
MLRIIALSLVLLAIAAGLAAGQSPDSSSAAAARQETALQRGQTPGWLSETIPEALKSGEFFGLKYWQWLGLLLLIFLGLVADYGVRVMFRPLIRRAVRRVQSGVDEQRLKDAVRALGLFTGAVVWLLLVKYLILSGTVREVATAAVGVYAVFTGTLAGWRFTDLAADVLMYMAKRTQAKYDDVLVPLLRKTIKVFIVAFGVIYGAQNLNINIVPLITGLGIGGLAFAFAAKDTIENFFGSIAVILDRPFEVGDWVLIGDVEGTVEELGFRSTRIRTFYNSQVTVPNAALVRANVDNYGRRTYRRWKTYIGVQYDTTPEQLLAFTEGIRELVRLHPYTRKDFYQVWCNDFADSSLNILLYVFFRVPDWATELRERERLFVDIVRLADHLGVQFAFPTRTVHLYREEPAPHQPRYEIPSGGDDRGAREAGADVARTITEGQPWREEQPSPVDFDRFATESQRRNAGGDE